MGQEVVALVAALGAVLADPVEVVAGLAGVVVEDARLVLVELEAHAGEGLFAFELDNSLDRNSRASRYLVLGEGSSEVFNLDALRKFVLLSFLFDLHQFALLVQRALDEELD